MGQARAERYSIIGKVNSHGQNQWVRRLKAHYEISIIDLVASSSGTIVAIGTYTMTSSSDPQILIA